jgi:pimeloyl-ACP methyl ester carboxylesterase
MGSSDIETIEHDGLSIVLQQQPGRAPTFLWLGGFKSDMAGTKAEALAAWAHARGQSFVRFDYSGHGRSAGKFEDGSISRWLGDALAILDRRTEGPAVLVGSSMGGWIALLAARARPSRIKGLILVAPAADMTERLMWASFPPEARASILETGRWERPSDYDPAPYIITRRLIEDGRRHLVMDGPISFGGPVHILQGEQDPDVPASHVRALAELIRAPDVTFDLIADGDHRLSRPQDLERLKRAADRMAALLAR